MMPKVGFEPTRPYGHYALNVARLPIPPLRRDNNFTFGALFVKKSQGYGGCFCSANTQVGVSACVVYNAYQVKLR
jgi:hypothetical protein